MGIHVIVGRSMWYFAYSETTSGGCWRFTTSQGYLLCFSDEFGVIMEEMDKKLTEQKCVPCEGGVDSYSEEEIQEYIDQIDVAWSIVDNKQLEREFVFDNFAQALEFVNQVGGIAEDENHHPDIFLHGYNKVRISLMTHAIGGLFRNDFIVAAKIDQLI